MAVGQGRFTQQTTGEDSVFVPEKWKGTGPGKDANKLKTAYERLKQEEDRQKAEAKVERWEPESRNAPGTPMRSADPLEQTLSSLYNVGEAITTASGFQGTQTFLDDNGNFDPGKLIPGITKFLVSLPTGMIGAPMMAPAQVGGAIGGADIPNVENGQISDVPLTESQRIGLGTTGAINAIGPFLGGSGKLLRATGGTAGALAGAGRMVNAGGQVARASQPVRQAIGRAGHALGTAAEWAGNPIANAATRLGGLTGRGAVTAHVLGDMAQEAGEEFVQELGEQFYRDPAMDWNKIDWGRAQENAAWGAAGGGIMSGAGQFGNWALRNRGFQNVAGLQNIEQQGPQQARPATPVPLTAEPNRVLTPGMKEYLNETNEMKEPEAAAWTMLIEPRGKVPPNRVDIGTDSFFDMYWNAPANKLETNQRQVMRMVGMDSRDAAQRQRFEQILTLSAEQRYQALLQIQQANKGTHGYITRAPAGSKESRIAFDFNLVRGHGASAHPALVSLLGGDYDGDLAGIEMGIGAANDGYLTQNLHNADMQRMGFGNYSGTRWRNQVNGQWRTIQGGPIKGTGIRLTRAMNNWIAANQPPQNPNQRGNRGQIPYLTARQKQLFDNAVNENDPAQLAQFADSYREALNNAGIRRDRAESIISGMLEAAADAGTQMQGEIWASQTNPNFDRKAWYDSLVNEYPVESIKAKGFSRTFAERLARLGKSLVQDITIRDNRVMRGVGSFYLNGQSITSETYQLLQGIPKESQAEVVQHLTRAVMNLAQAGGHINEEIRGIVNAAMRTEVDRVLNGRTLTKDMLLGTDGNPSWFLTEFADAVNPIINDFNAVKQDVTDIYGNVMDTNTLISQRVEGEFAHQRAVALFLELYATDQRSQLFNINQQDTAANGQSTLLEDLEAMYWHPETVTDLFMGDPDMDSLARTMLQQFTQAITQSERNASNFFEEIHRTTNGMINEAQEAQTWELNRRDNIQQGAKPLAQMPALQFIQQGWEQVFGVKAMARQGWINYETTLADANGARLFLGTQTEQKNTALKVILADDYADVIALQNDQTPANQMGINNTILMIANRISEKSPVHVQILSELRESVRRGEVPARSRTLDYLLDTNFDYDQKQMFWNEVNSSAHQSDLASTLVGHGSLGGGALSPSRKMQQARVSISKAERVSRKNATIIKEKLDGMYNNPRLDPVKVKAALIDTMQETFIDIDEDALVSSLMESAMASHKETEKGTSPDPDVINYSQSVTAHYGFMPQYVSDISLFSTGAMSQNEFTSNKQTLMDCLLNQNASYTVYTEAGCVTLNQAKLLANSGIEPRFDPDGSLSFYTITEFLQANPNFASRVADQSIQSFVVEGKQQSVLANTNNIENALTQRYNQDPSSLAARRRRISIKQAMTAVPGSRAGIFARLNGREDLTSANSFKRAINEYINDVEAMLLEDPNLQNGRLQQLLATIVQGYGDAVASSVQRSRTVVEARASLGNAMAGIRWGDEVHDLRLMNTFNQIMNGNFMGTVSFPNLALEVRQDILEIYGEIIQIEQEIIRSGISIQNLLNATGGILPNNPLYGLYRLFGGNPNSTQWLNFTSQQNPLASLIQQLATIMGKNNADAVNISMGIEPLTGRTNQRNSPNRFAVQQDMDVVERLIKEATPGRIVMDINLNPLSMAREAYQGYLNVMQAVQADLTRNGFNLFHQEKLEQRDFPPFRFGSQAIAEATSKAMSNTSSSRVGVEVGMGAVILEDTEWFKATTTTDIPGFNPQSKIREPGKDQATNQNVNGYMQAVYALFSKFTEAFALQSKKILDFGNAIYHMMARNFPQLTYTPGNVQALRNQIAATLTREYGRAVQSWSAADIALYMAPFVDGSTFASRVTVMTNPNTGATIDVPVPTAMCDTPQNIFAYLTQTEMQAGGRLEGLTPATFSAADIVKVELMFIPPQTINGYLRQEILGQRYLNPGQDWTSNNSQQTAQRALTDLRAFNLEGDDLVTGILESVAIADFGHKTNQIDPNLSSAEMRMVADINNFEDPLTVKAMRPETKVEETSLQRIETIRSAKNGVPGQLSPFTINSAEIDLREPNEHMANLRNNLSALPKTARTGFSFEGETPAYLLETDNQSKVQAAIKRSQETGVSLILGEQATRLAETRYTINMVRVADSIWTVFSPIAAAPYESALSKLPTAYSDKFDPKGLVLIFADQTGALVPHDTGTKIFRDSFTEKAPTLPPTLRTTNFDFKKQLKVNSVPQIVPVANLGQIDPADIVVVPNIDISATMQQQLVQSYLNNVANLPLITNDGISVSDVLPRQVMNLFQFMDTEGNVRYCPIFAPKDLEGQIVNATIDGLGTANITYVIETAIDTNARYIPQIKTNLSENAPDKAIADCNEDRAGALAQNLPPLTTPGMVQSGTNLKWDGACNWDSVKGRLAGQNEVEINSKFYYWFLRNQMSLFYTRLPNGQWQQTPFMQTQSPTQLEALLRGDMDTVNGWGRFSSTNPNMIQFLDANNQPVPAVSKLVASLELVKGANPAKFLTNVIVTNQGASAWVQKGELALAIETFSCDDLFNLYTAMDPNFARFWTRQGDILDANGNPQKCFFGPLTEIVGKGEENAKPSTGRKIGNQEMLEALIKGNQGNFSEDTIIGYSAARVGAYGPRAGRYAKGYNYAKVSEQSFSTPAPGTEAYLEYQRNPQKFMAIKAHQEALAKLKAESSTSLMKFVDPNGNPVDTGVGSIFANQQQRCARLLGVTDEQQFSADTFKKIISAGLASNYDQDLGWNVPESYITTVVSNIQRNIANNQFPLSFDYDAKTGRYSLPIVDCDTMHWLQNQPGVVQALANANNALQAQGQGRITWDQWVADACYDCLEVICTSPAGAKTNMLLNMLEMYCRENNVLVPDYITDNRGRRQVDRQTGAYQMQMTPQGTPVMQELFPSNDVIMTPKMLSNIQQETLQRIDPQGVDVQQRRAALIERQAQDFNRERIAQLQRTHKQVINGNLRGGFNYTYAYDNASTKWKGIRSVTNWVRTLGLLNFPTAWFSNLVGRQAAMKATQAAFAIGRGMHIGAYSSMVQLDHRAVDRFADTPVVKKLMWLIREQQVTSIDLRLADISSLTELEAHLDSIIESNPRNLNRFQNFVIKANAGGRFGLENQIEIWLSKVYSDMMLTDGYQAYTRDTGNGQNTFTDLLAKDPVGLAWMLLDPSPNNEAYSLAVNNFQFAQRGDLAQRSIPSVMYGMIMQRMPLADFFSTTCVCKFPQYAFNFAGKALNCLGVPMSTLHQVAGEYLQQYNGDNRFLLALQSEASDAALHYANLREAMMVDMQRFTMFGMVALLAGALPILEPPEDKDKWINYQEWTFFGLRIYDAWWIQDIIGPLLPMACSVKAAQLGRPMPDIVMKGMKKQLWSNPFMRIADVATMFCDPETALWDSPAEQQDTFDNIDPTVAWTMYMENALIGHAVNLATPNIVNDVYKAFQKEERSAKRVFKTDPLTGELVEGAKENYLTEKTTYEDYLLRKTYRMNPIASTILDWMIHPTTGYRYDEMPQTVYKDQGEYAIMKEYSVWDYDNEELKSQEDAEAIAADIISILMSTGKEGIVELREAGFVLDYTTLNYVGQCIWDITAKNREKYDAIEAETYFDYELWGEGDWELGRQRVTEFKQAYWDDYNYWKDLYYNVVWSDAMKTGVTEYTRYRTTYEQDAEGNTYATGFMPSLLLPYNFAPQEGTAGRAGDWVTPDADVGPGGGGNRALTKIEKDIETPKFEDLATATPRPTSSKRSGGGGGGSTPNIYSRVPNMAAPYPKEMNAVRLNDTRYDYLRPEFETKGSREAYKRSDI